jgi:hypothetical protein
MTIHSHSILITRLAVAPSLLLYSAAGHNRARKNASKRPHDSYNT